QGRSLIQKLCAEILPDARRELLVVGSHRRRADRSRRAILYHPDGSYGALLLLIGRLVGLVLALDLDVLGHRQYFDSLGQTDRDHTFRIAGEAYEIHCRVRLTGVGKEV